MNSSSKSYLKLASIVLSLSILSVPISSFAQTSNDNKAFVKKETKKAPEIHTQELISLIKNKQIVLFDARPSLEYSISHIPGSLNVAAKPGVSKALYISDVAEIGRLVKENKHAPIVIYCNGPFCGKAGRLGEELLEAGYLNTKRYQDGIPVWRAFGGITETGDAGVEYIANKDRTAVWVDAREKDASAKKPLTGAKNIPASGVVFKKDEGDIKKAKDDGRLPMNDHNTRIVVFAETTEQAASIAQALAKEAFHNVTYYNGSADQLIKLVGHKINK